MRALAAGVILFVVGTASGWVAGWHEVRCEWPTWSDARSVIADFWQEATK
jgi:hypothetical protein